jgi:hypothetical protein
MGMAIVFFVVLLLLPTCNLKKDADIDENSRCEAEQWAVDTGGAYDYWHDCNPFPGEHFTIYSDGSSTEAKQILANLAEEIFSELVVEFLIQSIEEDLQFTGGYTYYIYAVKNISPARAMGFRNGFYIPAIDCATSPGVYSDNPFNYRCMAKHEMTHVFQFTLTNCPGNSACPDWLGVWFREGQAIYMSGLGEAARVSTLNDFQAWISDPDHVCPVSIHRWNDFPYENQAGQYYPMFGLAYAYLVDTAYGHGATISDMRQLFRLMAEGDTFEEAFAKALGMTVSYYEENFYDLMEEYLSKLEPHGMGDLYAAQTVCVGYH